MERRYEKTDRDLMGDYDESKFDRVGAPLVQEQHDAGRPEHQQMAEQKTHTLTDLAAEYEFCTTGVIHACTPFDRDPLVECLHVHGDKIQAPVRIDTRFPMFKGLGVHTVGVPVDFDRRIYAVPRDSWEKVRDTIAGIVMTHRATGLFGMVNFSELYLVDQFKLAKMAVVDTLPTVPLTVFGVSTNKVFAYLAAREYPQHPTLVKEPPKQEVVAAGSRYIKG